MNENSCVLLSNFLGDDVMGYISHPNVLSSWMLGFLPYHEKWGEMLSNALCILYLIIYADIYATHHHLFSCLLISRRDDLTILWMLLLCLPLLLLIKDASPPVVYNDSLNSSTIKFVTSVDFSNTLPS